MTIVSIAGSVFALFDDKFFRRLSPQRRAWVYRKALKAKRLMSGTRFRSGTTIDTMPTSVGVPRTASRRLPAYLSSEIAAIRAEVDPSFFTAGDPPPSRYQSLYPVNPAPGQVYRALIGSMRRPVEEVSHIIVVPWLKQGGADLVALHHARDIVRRPGCRLLVISTLDEDSPWAKRLPDGAEFLELGKACGSLSQNDRRLVLSRLIVQSGARTVHVINSALAWSCLERYGTALASSGRSIYASLYCDDGPSAGGGRIGFAHDHLVAADPHVTGYLFDNSKYAGEIGRLYGVVEERRRVVYAPVEIGGGGAPAGRKVLWAGRLDRQKRVDLLAQIAALMPDVSFDVWGRRLLAIDEEALRALARLPNVVMKGGFDGFETLDLGEYGVFLHTSGWDGLPNTLLEAGAGGLPVVASDVGGIGDLVGERTGWAVKGEAAEYVAALREALSNAGDRSRSMVNLIRERHSKEAFSHAMDAVPGYFSAT